MPIELPEQTRSELVHSIKRYFLDERDEEIGDLQATFFLDFVLKEVGPSVYNKAVSDVQARLHYVVTDLDVNLNEPEFGYSAERGSKR